MIIMSEAEESVPWTTKTTTPMETNTVDYSMSQEYQHDSDDDYWGTGEEAVKLALASLGLSSVFDVTNYYNNSNNINDNNSHNGNDRSDSITEDIHNNATAPSISSSTSIEQSTMSPHASRSHSVDSYIAPLGGFNTVTQDFRSLPSGLVADLRVSATEADLLSAAEEGNLEMVKNLLPPLFDPSQSQLKKKNMKKEKKKEKKEGKMLNNNNNNSIANINSINTNNNSNNTNGSNSNVRDNSKDMSQSSSQLDRSNTAPANLSFMNSSAFAGNTETIHSSDSLLMMSKKGKAGNRKGIPSKPIFVDINCRGELGWTPLHLAAWSGMAQQI